MDTENTCESKSFDEAVRLRCKKKGRVDTRRGQTKTECWMAEVAHTIWQSVWLARKTQNK